MTGTFCLDLPTGLGVGDDGALGWRTCERPERFCGSGVASSSSESDSGVGGALLDFF